MTVSLALRGSPRISEKKREEIRAYAKEIGYSQNSFAASLVSLRTLKNPKYQATLALINCYDSREGWRNYPALLKIHEGIVERAKQLGYLIEEFWLNDPEISSARLHRTLVSRGIPGMLMAFVPDRGDAIAKLRDFNFAEFASATVGWRLDDLDIHSCSNDQYHTALLATQKLIRLGYRRIGLVLNEGLDAAIEHRLHAGYLLAVQELPRENRLQPFWPPTLAPEPFLKWIRKSRLDAVLSLPAGLHRWVLDGGLRIPKDLGFAYLDRVTPKDGLAGVDQKGELVGLAAVDMVVSLLHRNERGIPHYQKSMLIRGEWVTAWSVRSSAKKRAKVYP